MFQLIFKLKTIYTDSDDPTFIVLKNSHVID